MRLKNHGFSLVGVMVASGAGLIMMTALSTHLLSNARMTRHLESKMESMQLKQELTLLLGNDISCDSSFGGLTGLPVGSSGSDGYTAITSQLTGTIRPLSVLKTSYSGDTNRFIDVTAVSLFKPLNKLGGGANDGTVPPNQYEYKVQMTVEAKGGFGMAMKVDGPTVVLTAPGGNVANDATACIGVSATVPNCAVGQVLTGNGSGFSCVSTAGTTYSNYGGSFSDGGVNSYWGINSMANPYTGGASCPEGFTASPTMSWCQSVMGDCQTATIYICTR